MDVVSLGALAVINQLPHHARRCAAATAKISRRTSAINSSASDQ